MPDDLTLISLPTSPYAARIRIQCAAKGIELKIADPEPGVTRGDHAAVNPFRRIPVLETTDGPLIESFAIAEYLEDRFPEPPLRPRDPYPAGRVRAFVLAVDHYLFPVLFELRASMGGEAPSADVLNRMQYALDGLDRLLDGSGYALGDRLTLADCALAPAWFYLERFLAAGGQEPPEYGHAPLAAWWDAVRRDPAVADVLSGMERALREAGR